ncbi:MAG TPA: phage protein NinX family protein [Candidimonas sp.]|nr:phage protein NinX family protein [Candidimonas sp.]
MKVSELTGAELDYWVGKIEKDIQNCPFLTFRKPYSTEWEFGGPIIERERIELTNYNGIHNGKLSTKWRANNCRQFDHPLPLVAAMRAYVASKYGEEVPEIAQ